MRLVALQSIDLPFSLPNSISVFNGSMYITSGVDNAVYSASIDKYNFDCFVGNKCGLGQYSFREPVHAYAVDDGLYVCDWHNHRVVKYVEGRYVTEAGMLGSDKAFTKNLLRVLKNFGVAGSYIHSHFSGASEKPLKEVKTSWLPNALYFLRSSLRLKSKRFHRMQKPNGACSMNGNIVVSQKNGARLDVMTRDLVKLFSADLPCNGRVGNVTTTNGISLVCVESEGRVFRVGDDFELHELKLFWRLDNPKPFCAIAVASTLVAIIAMDTLYVFDLVSGSELTSIVLGGELHGLDSDGEKIYALDRLNSRLHVLKVSYD